MSRPRKIPETVAGSLLVAHPAMRDPNFNRTVLYMVAHDRAQGALGLILNRPVHRDLPSLVDTKDVPHLSRIPVFWGGPVGANQLSLARVRWRPVPGRLEFQHNLSLEEAGAVAVDPASDVRAFIGYAGWSGGQLENELAGNAWVVKQPKRAHVETEDLPALWRRIMHELGPWWTLQAGAPDDPARN